MLYDQHQSLIDNKNQDNSIAAMAHSASTPPAPALVGQRPGETPEEAMDRIVAEYQRCAHGNSVVQPMHQNPMAWDARADTASGLRSTGRSAASMPTAGSAPRPLAAGGRIRPGTPLASSDINEAHVHPVSGLRATDSECRADSTLLNPPQDVRGGAADAVEEPPHGPAPLRGRALLRRPALAR